MRKYDRYDDWDDESFDPFASRRQRRRPGHKPRRSQADILSGLVEQTEGQESFDFTYNASHHEQEWITDSLGNFHEQQWIEDVLRLVKGGKEASVYQCSANPHLVAPGQAYIAAKVYRPRQFRNLRNDSLYREGRHNLDSNGNEILDGRMQHAIQKRTEYGKQLLHTSWIEHEYQALQILHAAGADTPIPYTRGNNAILMEYVGGAEIAAPVLNSIHLSPTEATSLFRRVLRNIELMLANSLVHGDLSAYNILYWEGEITLIDFPQAISPETNRNAYRIFERDVTRVCEYFARQGVASDPRRIVAGLWTAYHYRLTPEVEPRYLDDQDEEALAIWKSQAGE